MKHLTTDQLLEVRDGGGSSNERGHVSSCSECAAEVERLESMASLLRGLPGLAPERDRWPEIRAAIETEERAWIPRAIAGTILALAASIILIVIFPGGDPAEGPAAPITDSEIDDLVRQSQRLESILRQTGSEGRVTDGWQVRTVADLQDRIALIDSELAEENARRASPERRARLWRVRVGLMNELVEARVPRSQYVEF
jgi:hypothetical protein